MCSKLSTGPFIRKINHAHNFNLPFRFISFYYNNVTCKFDRSTQKEKHGAVNLMMIILVIL